jgi:4-hydroxybenzoate polyprenyltransferase
MLLHLFLSLRPRQWIKNSFLLVGLIFSGQFADRHADKQVAVAFILFCLLSSAVYLTNDVLDAKTDRLHPQKKDRPVAAGLISVPLALATAAGLILAALAGMRWGLGREVMVPFAFISILYLANNALYFAFFKQRAIMDVFSLSLGYVLRIMAGNVVIQEETTGWIVICSFALALFLGFCKRYTELNLMGANAGITRQSLSLVSREILRGLLLATLTFCITNYTLFTILGNQNINLIFTVPLVLYALLRFYYLVVGKTSTKQMEDLILDRQLLAVLAIWLAVCLVVIYTDLSSSLHLFRR